MRRSKPMSIGELWSGFVSENPARMRRLTEARVPDVWQAMMGPAVMSLTSSVELRNGTLYVALTSSVLRQELFMRRADMMHELNKRLGMDVVRAIVIR